MISRALRFIAHKNGAHLQVGIVLMISFFHLFSLITSASCATEVNLE